MSFALEHHPFFKMMLASHFIMHQANVALEDSGCYSISYLRILMKVTLSGGCLQKDIASKIGHSDAAISRHIKSLLEDGLITKTPTPQDKRAHLINLTAKGQRAYEECMQHFLPVLDEHYALLSQQEQEQFSILLDKLFTQIKPHIPHLSSTYGS